VERRAEDRGRDCEAGGYQLTRELTLQEIGEELADAAKELTWAQRKDVAAALLENLVSVKRTPSTSKRRGRWFG
jgi:predicted phage gp36 major capsid-like protein